LEILSPQGRRIFLVTKVPKHIVLVPPPVFINENWRCAYNRVRMIFSAPS